MKNEEIKIILQEAIVDERITVYGVLDINQKPHAFTIGPEHIKEAQHHGGQLNDAVIEKVGCSVAGCTLPYAEHTSDTVVFLQFSADITSKDLQDELKVIIDNHPEIFNESCVEGFSFVEGAGIILK
tara:strand:+ start:1142 stop:1522 length:381 start_codon:yes stop_codon:yes gene_type:complete